MQRLTPSLLSKLDPKTEVRERDIVDAEVRGFGVRIRPFQSPTFYFRYSSPKLKKIRRISIGDINGIPLAEARAIAREFRAALARGLEPADTRLRAAQAATIGDLFNRYFVEHVQRNNKPATVSDVRYVWARFILPRIGDLAIEAITRADVYAIFSGISSKGLANLTLSYLSKAFSLAEIWGIRPDGSNPCRTIKRHRIRGRDRVLPPEELRALWLALDTAAERYPSVVLMARLLLLTGARGSEIRKARLEHIDWARKILKLRDSKTGPGELELPDEALEMIRAARRPRASTYIVPGYRRGGLTRFYEEWGEIRTAAGLGDLKLHDLRHAFGTYAHHSGATQRQIMDMLRHSDFRTSQRYIQGFKTERRRGAENTVRAIISAISPMEDRQPDNPEAPVSSSESRL